MLGAALLLASAAPEARLGEIRAQLFYETSGTLSGDIARPGAFSGWNTVIGEGPAKEAAQDVLVAVRLLNADGAVDAALTTTPLVVTAKDGRGRVLATRRFTSVLIPMRGGTWNALWLRNATCGGKVRVEARFGAQVRRATLNLDCGE
jgi:hypothetical protein